MAKNKESEKIDEAEAKPKSSLKKIIFLVVGALLMIGISVGATLYLTGFFEPKPEVGESVAVEEEESGKEAQYFQIDPSFIINFQNRGRQRYLKADVALMTRDDEVFAAFEEHMPLIKSKLLNLMGAEVYEDLQTHEGRELLRQKIQNSVADILQDEIGKGDAVENVLFVNFVMQ